MSYKKRAKDGWNCGKSYKRDSNKQERIYEKGEIRQAMQEYEEGEDYKYPHKAKRTHNRKMQLENRIEKYERWIKDRTWMDGWWTEHLKKSLEKMKNEYAEKFVDSEENDLSV